MGALPVGLPIFVVAGSVSLAASWVLVSRIERLGTTFALSGALLGLIAALAADGPEITSAITAFGHHQGTVGAGVVLGSNVFNLAALLGLSAMFAGWIHLHRKVVLLSGSVAIWVAAVSLLVVVGPLSATSGLLLVFAVLVPYVIVLGMRRSQLHRLPVPLSWRAWLVRAIREEESELAEAQSLRTFGRRDYWVAGLSLVLVIGASATMERAASALGSRYSVPDLVIGALVLAGVTSLPNAVAASYLALRGRGAATLSTALNSNALNVAIGLLLPATILGIATSSDGGPLVASFYVGLTVVSLAMAYVLGGLNPPAGAVIIGGYFVFVGAVLATSGLPPAWLGTGLVLGLAILIGAMLCPSGHRGRVRHQRQAPDSGGVDPPTHTPASTIHKGAHPTLIPGWSTRRLVVLGFSSATIIAAIDAALGRRVLLLGLVAVAPCCVLLTRRWGLTALAGFWAVGLTVVLGLPDRIWATAGHAEFLTAVGVVSVVATQVSFALGRVNPSPD